MNARQGQRGFSLTELRVDVAVTAILLMAFKSNVQNMNFQARQSAVEPAASRSPAVPVNRSATSSASPATCAPAA